LFFFKRESISVAAAVADLAVDVLALFTLFALPLQPLFWKVYPIEIRLVEHRNAF